MQLFFIWISYGQNIPFFHFLPMQYCKSTKFRVRFNFAIFANSQNKNAQNLL